MKSVASMFAGLLALCVASCAQAPAQEAGAITPLLYVVRDRDSTMYLYGTVHVRPRGADWGNARVRAAIDESTEIWTELLMNPQADQQIQVMAQQLGTAESGRPLSSWLTPEENASLNAVTTRLGFPQGALEGYKPWLAALTLTVAPLIRAGYDPNSGVDRSIDSYADAAGKTMRALETAEQQLTFFANLSPEIQREMLQEAIAESEDLPAMIAEMSTAWEQGDEAALSRTVVEETRTDYPELYQMLFLDRNNAWMTTLTHEMEGSGVDFVAVGAGHIIGRDGLVAQFRARGYRVERVR
ncbi:MAG: TraB/GumN family protein [Alphaproteobacteria bacterium]|nr:TraB/GumN family protein [Alphaproteobacteria bacterium]